MNQTALACMPQADVAGFAAFAQDLRLALASLALSQGQDMTPLERTYTALWPDGQSLRLSRLVDGSVEARLSGGGRLRLGHWQELAAAAMLLHDPELYAMVRRRETR